MDTTTISLRLLLEAPGLLQGAVRVPVMTGNLVVPPMPGPKALTQAIWVVQVGMIQDPVVLGAGLPLTLRCRF